MTLIDSAVRSLIDWQQERLGEHVRCMAKIGDNLNVCLRISNIDCMCEGIINKATGQIFWATIDYNEEAMRYDTKCIMADRCPHMSKPYGVNW